MPSGPTQSGETSDPTALDYIALGFAWLIPGVAHLVIGERVRGVIFMITIHLLFFAGLFIGGTQCISPSDQPIWSITQFLAGWPMLLARLLQRIPVGGPAEYSPRIQDVGAVYCGIAGMLNLLVLFDAMLRISGGKGETGQKEGEKP